MSIAGNLKTMDLAELLQWLSQAQKTGTLVIHNGKVEKRLFLQDGKIVSSASTDPREYLGHFLVSQGLITEQQLSQAISRQANEKMLLGKILLTNGVVTEEDLQRLLRLKAEEGIYDIFTWQKGEFRFLNGELPEHTFVPLRLDLTGILMEGARRVDEWKRIREHIPSKDVVAVGFGKLDDPTASPGARRILSMINDDRTVEEIQLQTHSSEFFVCSVLFDKIQKGQVKVVRPRVVRVEVPVPGPPAQGPAPQGQAAQPAQQPASGQAAPAQGQQGGGFTPPNPAAAQAPAGQAPAARPQAGVPLQGAPPAAPAQPAARPTTGAAGGGPGEGDGDSFSQLDPDALMTAAAQMVQKGDFERALRYLRAARSLRPDDRNLEGAVASAEQQIRRSLERGGLTVDKVPKLAVPMEELTSLNVSAQEGFLLTRIDGRYDIKSILKISPMPEIDALVLFFRLMRAGHIRF
ncbi:MAG: DUF4388 domain-containing protein [Acidobacteriota bacterium]|nr:DUF4388 domain-containing protein [Acidobacteriota bacterium]